MAVMDIEQIPIADTQAIVELLEMVEADDDPQPGELARLRAEIARLRGE
jgi:hypothetical protein